MLAYDDAIHGVTGKAGENRIFNLDINYEPFRKMFVSADCFYIEEGDFPTLAGWLRQLPQQLGMDVAWTDAPAAGAKTISLCEDIFALDDLGLSKVYVDIDKCILQDEDDVLDVINYNYSKRSFILAQKPVFLENINQFLTSPQDSNCP
jgi:hypothetical protein